jgi:hypothetical protein
MRYGAVRLSVVVLSLVAWFALSNHCALGSVAATGQPAAEMSGCPMHSSPAKKTPTTRTPCCKDVRAIVAKCVSANSCVARLVGSREIAREILQQPARVSNNLHILDTGPPGCFSFAESVLQESVLSHAPPIS